MQVLLRCGKPVGLALDAQQQIIQLRPQAHANPITVSNTYGHLAEHFREEQIRTRFTPLSEQLRDEAARRQRELDAIWQATQPKDWRTYGAVEPTSSHPHRSFLRTHKGVLQAFMQAEPSG